MDNKAYTAVVLTLIVLIGVALWQFYSLVRGDYLNNRYTVGAPDSPGSMDQRSVPAAKPK